MKTATHIRCLENQRKLATLYRLSEPLDGYTYVIVSAVMVPHTGPETYIFGSDAEGNYPPDMRELPGSFRGGMNHEIALNYAGYVIEYRVADYNDETMFDIN